MKPEKAGKIQETEQQDKDLHTEEPISERDEVKKAEDRTQELQKKSKEMANDKTDEE